MTKSNEELLEDERGSEFGAGIVVCLVKFSEHMYEHGFFSERTIRDYAHLTEEELSRLRAEAARYPKGDAAAKLLRLSVIHEDIYGSKEVALSHLIEMWMNAASDHMYDLDERAPEPLKELAALTLRIGHGFSGETWTIEHVDKIRELWQAATLSVDRMIGLEPDWGSY